MHKRRFGRIRAQGVASHLRAGSSFSPGVGVENLSRGGAFVRTHEVMPVGTPVVVDLVRPGLKKALRLTGRVASAVSPEDAKSRRVTPGMGIQFDPYSADVEHRLLELLQSLAPGDAVLEGDLPENAPQREAKPAPPRAPPARAEESRPQRPVARAPERPAPVRSSRPPAPPAAAPPILVPGAPVARPMDAGSVTVPESAKLMVQVKGLLMELGDSQSRSSTLERENEELRAEVERLKAQLSQRAR